MLFGSPNTDKKDTEEIAAEVLRKNLFGERDDGAEYQGHSIVETVDFPGSFYFQHERLSLTNETDGIIRIESGRRGHHTTFNFEADICVGEDPQEPRRLKPVSAAYRFTPEREDIRKIIFETFTVDVERGTAELKLEQLGRNLFGGGFPWLSAVYNLRGEYQHSEGRTGPTVKGIDPVVYADLPRIFPRVPRQIDIPATLLNMRDAVEPEPERAYDLIVPA